MSATAVDTSIVVAGLCAWHEAHVDSLRALGAAIKAGGVVLPAPALVEAYSVMTRLPSPHRLSPTDAHSILGRSFEGRATVVALSAAETWRLLGDAAASGVAGGAAYDLLILACARKAGAERLLTLDMADFTRLPREGIEITSPRAA